MVPSVGPLKTERGRSKDSTMNGHTLNSSGHGGDCRMGSISGLLRFQSSRSVHAMSRRRRRAIHRYSLF